MTTTNSLGQLMLLSGYTVTTNSGIVSTNAVPAVKGPGNANDYVQVTATYYVNTITPLVAAYGSGYSRQGWNTFPVRVSAIVKNEPALSEFRAHEHVLGRAMKALLLLSSLRARAGDARARPSSSSPSSCPSSS